MPPPPARKLWLALLLSILVLPALAQTASSPAADPPAAAPLLEHDSASGNIVRFVDARGDFRYRYDASNRLLEASRAGDVQALLQYDADGQFSGLQIRLHDATEAKVLHLTRDRQGRTIVMILEGQGRVKIRYRKDGEPVMHSNMKPDGHRELFGMFGTLNMLTSPAGIKVKTE